jgi:GTP-dependent phosphoenolpyruvate carboxykinase
MQNMKLLLGYRGDPCKSLPELNPAGVFLALDRKDAMLYGYVRHASVQVWNGILRFSTHDMPAYQEQWIQYCERNSSVNPKAFAAAFIVKEGAVFRDSEFLKDAVVMAFFKATYDHEYDGVYFHELPTLVDGQPHHEEIFIFDPASVTLSSDIVDLEYNDAKMKVMRLKKQEAISLLETKKRKQRRPSSPTEEAKKKLFF